MCINYIASFGKHNGEMSEWLKEHAWKACVRETVPRVRIPLSPPFFYPKSSIVRLSGGRWVSRKGDP